MPYLQLDVNGHYPVEEKKRLVTRLSETYSGMLDVDVSRISIAIRELGEGGLWRTIDGEPRPVAVLMCDIRRGLNNFVWMWPKPCARIASIFSV